MNFDTADLAATVKVEAAQLSGAALTWSVCQAERWNVVIVMVDGEAQVWHAGDVSAYNPRCHNGRDGNPRFLVAGEPVGIFGSQIELGGEWFLEAIDQHTLEIRPGLFNSKVWAAWGQTAHGGRNSQQGKTGPNPLIAAQRCLVAKVLGDEVEVPEELLAPAMSPRGQA